MKEKIKKVMAFVLFIIANKQEFVEAWDEIQDIIELIREYIEDQKSLKNGKER